MEPYTSPLISISKGNSKLGAVASISLPPVVTCAPNVPCAKVCYAQKAYRMYKTTRAAYNRNLEIWNTDPEGYIYAIAEYIARNNIKRFRWHVSGDIVDDKYYIGMLALAQSCEDTYFMSYTKKWEYVFEPRPRNLNILCSMWPGLMEQNQDLLKRKFGKNLTQEQTIEAMSCVTPLAWYIPRDIEAVTDSVYKEQLKTNIPEKGVECPGNCDNCFICWHTPENTHITFNQH